ncbi:hypothetical protein SEA_PHORBESPHLOWER_48 [Gordonia phage PhorbesPhlower]|nr:hypothetical protein SEA_PHORBESPHLOWER_48 [Gordonia phage PhorbesPhlower]
MTGDSDIGRAWRELAELVRRHEGVLTINHWERPNGDPYHRVCANGFPDLEEQFIAESPDLAEALTRVRNSLAMRTPTPLRLVR